MTPYKDRHLRNEYSVGTIATTVTPPAEETAPDAPVVEAPAVEDEPDGEFVCEICGRQFMGQQGLKIHLTKMHPEETSDD